ncbi:Leucine Rich Repeat [Seminavis robusta]|uniref:Leucine Rich Repeat n=1 Tax=Seminavis robusta TaxID=568900 RepID=A0A9N8HDN0_9STRA|nr:Leucine Rich Repeat [Seminavis robusta]|eukprot:Sro469_g149270.1 Leucine Rich Repeat (846) ;mRNA; r:3949-7143
MQSTKNDDDDANQAAMMPSDTGTEEAEESQPRPPTRRTGTSRTGTPRDLDESNQSHSTSDDVIEKALRIRSSGGTCEAGDAEHRKLLAFEQEARASKTKSSDKSHNDIRRTSRTRTKKSARNKDTAPTTATQNTYTGTEETLDPLDLAKIVEARLKDSDDNPAVQERAKNLHPTNKGLQATSVGPETQGYEEEGLSPLDLAKIVEARLQDSSLDQGENTTTPEWGNSPPAVDTIEQQNHQEPKLSDMSGTGEANRIGLVDTNVAPDDTVQNDDNFGNMPPLERTTANRRAQVLPGAFPSGGNSQAGEEDLETTEMTRIEPATTQPPTIEPENGNSGLAVANLVDEDEYIAPEDLPQAQDYNLENENGSIETRMKEFKTKVLLGVIVLLAITIILVAIVTPRKKQDDPVPTSTPSEFPSSNPSQGPSSYSAYWLSLFPESTVSTILEDPESPQSMAFEWLVEEIDILRNLTAQRVVQRFVLATFYFANSDDQWSFSDNWLNHSVHECLWYSGLEDFYFFFGADQLLPLDHISPCEQDPAGYLEDGILYQGDGIMRHLWLQFNGLVGSGIPPELYLLTELRSLGLDELNLTSTIPEELSGLPSLEYISMNFCSLYGSIPEALGSWSKLGIMYFGWNSLTGTLPSSLFSLTMQSVALPENQLTGPLPTELGLLTKKKLNVNRTGIANSFGGLILSGAIPNELAALTDMILLYLDNSGFNGTIPKWLDSMTSIDTLFLSDNSFTGTIPTELGLLTEMLVLWLNSNALSGTIPTEIGMYEQVSQLCGCDLCICSDNTTSQTLEGERLVYVDGQLLLLSDEGYLLPLSEANLTEGNQTEPRTELLDDSAHS